MPKIVDKESKKKEIVAAAIKIFAANGVAKTKMADIAAEAGVKAIIQPGGSIRDDEVIQAADEHDIAMVFSGQRYFRH